MNLIMGKVKNIYHILEELAESYPQAITINGEYFSTAEAATTAFSGYEGPVDIFFPKLDEEAIESIQKAQAMTNTEKALWKKFEDQDAIDLTLKNGEEVRIQKMNVAWEAFRVDCPDGEVKHGLTMAQVGHLLNTLVKRDKVYRIKVKKYMTQEGTPEFDFMQKWNNNIPMPFRIMAGRKIQETKGMVKMTCWGQMFSEQESHCFKCGKKLVNPVSKYFGLGPECGGHNYTNPFNTEEELIAAVHNNMKFLASIEWTGWIPKSAIVEEEEIC